MLRWNPTLVRATAAAAVVAMVLTTVAGAFGMPGVALLVLLPVAVGIAVVAVVAHARRNPPR